MAGRGEVPPEGGATTGARGGNRRGGETIGHRVHRLRGERGLTQREVAEPSYTAAYISTIEAGKVRPSEKALRHIAERLGSTYEEVVSGRPAYLALELRARLTDAQRALATEDPATAIPLYEALVREADECALAPELSTALVGLGQCALESGELEGARAHFERAEAVLVEAGGSLPQRVPAV
ncbi:helix-turn-helix transcriptional regulator, partial [Streptomyces sp. SID7982]|nr:helix-turn-helix transcriptional regulator [Streptomyces sp. SID7982]